MSGNDQAVAGALTAMLEVLEGTGQHADHVRQQVGRCVLCSCGARVQGRAVNLPPTTASGEPVHELVLVDGFVAYRGIERACRDRVPKHPGSTVRRAS